MASFTKGIKGVSIIYKKKKIIFEVVKIAQATLDLLKVNGIISVLFS